MKTKVIRMNPQELDMEGIREAGEILRQGGLVAFPTETVYGLGGNGLDPQASAKIYRAKGRPSDNPLIIHIADMEDLEKIVKEVPESAKKLASVFTGSGSWKSSAYGLELCSKCGYGRRSISKCTEKNRNPYG